MTRAGRSRSSELALSRTSFHASHRAQGLRCSQDFVTNDHWRNPSLPAEDRFLTLPARSWGRSQRAAQGRFRMSDRPIGQGAIARFVPLDMRKTHGMTGLWFSFSGHAPGQGVLVGIPAPVQRQTGAVHAMLRRALHARAQTRWNPVRTGVSTPFSLAPSRSSSRLA